MALLKDSVLDIHEAVHILVLTFELYESPRLQLFELMLNMLLGTSVSLRHDIANLFNSDRLPPHFEEDCQLHEKAEFDLHFMFLPCPTFVKKQCISYKRTPCESGPLNTMFN